MSADIGNLVCDAVADPPGNSEETSLKEQIRIQEQKNQKTPPKPEISNNSDKRNHQPTNCENGSGSDDRDSNHEKEQERKPRRKSRKNSSSKNNRGMTINTVVSGSTNVCINLSNQTQINVNANGASASRKERERSKEASKEMPQYIKNLTECKSTITAIDKLTTKQYIGSNWKQVAKNLDLKKSEVEQCFIDYSKEGIGEVMFQVLTIWNHRYGKLATLGALIKALWTAKEYVCAEELAIVHKSD